MTFAELLRLTYRRLLPRRLRAVVKGALFRLFKATGIESPSRLKIGSFNGFEFAYRRGTADEWVLQASSHDDMYFWRVPDYHPRESDIIVDIGARIGTFAVLAASKVPHGAVRAIEACGETFNLLRINAALNGSANVITHHLAISDREGLCALYQDSHNWGHSTVHQQSYHSETVGCCSLEQFFEKTHTEKCNFVRMNCEGAEFPILLSTPRDVLRRIRMMLVDYHCDLWTMNSKEDLVSHLEGSGFDRSFHASNDDRGWIVPPNMDWVDVRPIPGLGRCHGHC
jgi:FkbM family methyltransferase